MRDGLDQQAFYPTLLRIAAPIALQELAFAVLNAVDFLMIGQLGETAVAAATLGSQFFFLLAVLMFGIGSGSAVFGAQFWGKRDLAGIRHVLGMTLTIAIAAGTAFALIAILAPTVVLRFYTTDPAVIALGSQYLRILGFGFLPFVVGNTYSFLLRSMGQVRMPAAIGIVSLLLKTGLAYLLIFGKAGFPQMGALGAATAVLVMRFVITGVLLMWVYVQRGPLAAGPRALAGFVSEHWLIRRFAVIAAPVIAAEFLWALAGSLYQSIYARVGTDAVAAVNIAATTEMIAFVPFSGLTAAVATIIGNSIGAGHDSRTGQDARRTLALTAALGACMGGLLLLASRFVPGLYNVSPQTQASAAAVMVVMAFGVVPRTTNLVMLAGILRSGGDTRFAFAIDVGAAWLVGIPLAALLGLVLGLPIQYVVLAALTEESVKCAFSLRRTLSGRWAHNVVRHAEA